MMNVMGSKMVLKAAFSSAFPQMVLAKKAALRIILGLSVSKAAVCTHIMPRK